MKKKRIEIETVRIRGVGIDDRVLDLAQIKVLILKAARARRLKKRGTFSTPWGEGFVKQNGDVTIGCQKYSWLSDIAPFAKSLGWV